MQLIIFRIIPPNVGKLPVNSSLTKRITKHDFPTPESPSKTSLKLNVGRAINYNSIKNNK